MGRITNDCMSDEPVLFELPPADLKGGEKKCKERNRIWTGCKAKLIERYLFYFVQITYHGTYMDGFAGHRTGQAELGQSRKESTPKMVRTSILRIKRVQVEY